MYPVIRVDKLHPDGSRRASWEAYRLPDVDGWLRLWTAPRTPRVHVNGRWVPDAPLVTAWVPGARFVVNRYEEAGVTGLYVDIVRAAGVSDARFFYIDLYVDVVSYAGRVWSKDEELLERLDAIEASEVLAVRDELLAAVRAGTAPFELEHPRWSVPDDARSLAPGRELALTD